MAGQGSTGFEAPVAPTNSLRSQAFGKKILKPRIAGQFVLLGSRETPQRFRSPCRSQVHVVGTVATDLRPEGLRICRREGRVRSQPGRRLEALDGAVRSCRHLDP